MTKHLTLLAFAVFATAFFSCDNSEETTPDAPTLTPPASVTDVQVGTSTDVTFAVTVPGGYKSVTITATGGTGTKKSEPAAGDKSGNVVVTFGADNTAGAGTVAITVTDNNNKTSSQSAAVNKTAEPVIETVVVSGLIEADVTWANDKYYEIANRVIVTNGATLTIEAGTIIKGRTGEGSLASALIISRGSKIMAEGTAEAPIIFTSVEDDLTYGDEDMVGSTLTKLDNSKWGGLIVLGAAPISAKAGDNETNIEGIPADEDFGVYGGDNAADNSGVLKYVSIRHGGALIGAGNEINGLTLGGVGSGTVIENIEIFATLDDGIELFGGTVSIDNLLVYWQGDDAIDIDMSYAGTISNFLVYHGDGGTDEGLEIDGPEGTVNKEGFFTLINGTLISDGVGSAADIKADAQGTLNNIVFSGYASAKLKFEGEYTAGDCSDHASKAYKDAVQNLIDGKFDIIDSKFDELSVYSKVDANNAPLCATVSDADKNAVASMAISKTDATGADSSVFAWTATFSGGFAE